jgi:hypothetical protein
VSAGTQHLLVETEETLMMDQRHDPVALSPSRGRQCVQVPDLPLSKQSNLSNAIIEEVDLYHNGTN